jgi:hypothetical protein
LQFEATLDGGAQVHNDGTYGCPAATDVRTKWMQVPKVATYPESLWQQPDSEVDGRVAGRKAFSSSQLPPGTVIFGRWSDAMIASWAGVEILVNPFVKAITTGSVLDRAELAKGFAAIADAFVSRLTAASEIPASNNNHLHPVRRPY